MRINTEKFGTIDISDDKIITFDNGIIGFQDYKSIHSYTMQTRRKSQILP